MRKRIKLLWWLLRHPVFTFSVIFGKEPSEHTCALKELDEAWAERLE